MKDMNQIIVERVILDCSKEKAFDMFTVNQHLESWLTLKADVDPVKGGKYHLYWDVKNPDQNSTKGCNILAIEKPDYLNFEWKGAEQHKDFMNIARPFTNVSVIFIAKGEQTEVILFHTGWGDTPEWLDALEWFRNAWKSTLENLTRCVKKTYNNPNERISLHN